MKTLDSLQEELAWEREQSARLAAAIAALTDERAALVAALKYYAQDRATPIDDEGWLLRSWDNTVACAALAALAASPPPDGVVGEEAPSGAVYAPERDGRSDKG